MKRSILTGSLLVVTLLQSFAHAQIVDLPDPGGDTGSQTHVTPTPNTPPVQTQFAGLLRMGSLSRKGGGTLYKIDFAPASRLQRLDVRVSANRLKIYSTNLVTTSGNKIPVQQLSNTSVISTNAVVNSENITLNENVSSIEMLLESYDGEADVILTAVASSDVPKMTLRQEVKPQPQEPAVVIPTPDNNSNNGGYQPEPYPEPYNPDGGSVVYYGNRFEYGDKVLYRRTQVGEVVDVYGDEVVVRFDTGYERSVLAKDLAKSVRCKQNICEGSRIVTTYNGAAGTVVTIFDNGIVEHYLDATRYSIHRSLINELGPERRPSRPTQGANPLRCTNDRRLCVGDSVHHPDGYVVEIVALYSNGTAVVRDAAGSETVRTSSLRPVRRGGSFFGL